MLDEGDDHAGLALSGKAGAAAPEQSGSFLRHPLAGRAWAGWLTQFQDGRPGLKSFLSGSAKAVSIPFLLSFSRHILPLLFFASPVLAEDLPLPQFRPLPPYSQGVELTPTATIKPPATAPVTVPPHTAQEERELALLELERQVIESQARRQIAQAHAAGAASSLRQVIVMQGPVAASVSRAANPPAVTGGQVALIGLEKGAVAGKSLEQFFGAPMTPDREKALLDAVQSQLATKDRPKVEVRIAGWWPEQGVMAVSVVPKG